MAENNDFQYGMGLDIKNFVNNFKRAASFAKEMGSTIKSGLGDQAAESAKAATKEMRSFSEKTKGYIKDVSRIITGILISQAFYSLIRQIRAASRELKNFVLGMEKAAVTFSVLLKSNVVAEGFLKQLESLALVLPVDINMLQEGALQLKAMGIAIESIIPTLRTLLDAAAVNPDTTAFSRIVLALGQIKAAGTLNATELRQLYNANIPIYEILQKQLGLTGDQLERIGDLAIPADLAIAAILRGIKEEFGGAAESISKTITGITQIIKNNLLSMGRTLLQVPFDKFRGFLENVLTVIKELRAVLETYGIQGLLVRIFPPEVVAAIFNIIVSIKGIGIELKKLAQALWPIIKLLGQQLLNAFELLLPVIVKLLQALNKLAGWLLRNEKAVRIFVAAISSLIIASLVASALTKLVAAIKLLAITGPVAQAVLWLAKAIRALYVAALADPKIAIFTLIAGGLLLIALSSEEAQIKLNQLSAELNRLMGLDYSFLDQEDVAQRTGKAIDNYNEDLANAINTNDDLTGSIADAKKAMEGFIASFDEVYGPSKNTSGTAIGAFLEYFRGLGEITIPEIELPTLPEMVIPDFGDALYSGELGEFLLKVRGIREELEKIYAPIRAIKQLVTGSFAVLFGVANEKQIKQLSKVGSKILELQEKWETMCIVVKEFFALVKLSIEGLLFDFDYFKKTVVAAMLAMFGPEVAAMVLANLTTVQNVFKGIETAIDAVVKFGIDAWNLLMLNWKMQIEGFKILWDKAITFIQAVLLAFIRTGLLVIFGFARKVIDKIQEIKDRWAERLTELREKWGDEVGLMKILFLGFVPFVIEELVRLKYEWFARILDIRKEWELGIKILTKVFLVFIGTVFEKLREIKDFFAVLLQLMGLLPKQGDKTNKGITKGLLEMIKDLAIPITNFKIPGMAAGGVVKKDSLFRLGENTGRGEKEMVTPLNRQSMEPFAQLLAEYLGPLVAGSQGQDELPPVTVILEMEKTELGRATIKGINAYQRSVGKVLLEF